MNLRKTILQQENKKKFENTRKRVPQSTGPLQSPESSDIMKIVIQRVSQAQVTIENQIAGKIGPGLLLLVGIAPGDTVQVMRAMVDKIVHLRIFNDADGRMNLSVKDTGGGLLAVSQFTLYADCKKGRRPSYTGAAAPDVARDAFEQFLTILKETGLSVETGQFQATMQVSLVNDGPVTIVLDSDTLFPVKS